MNDFDCVRFALDNGSAAWEALRRIEAELTGLRRKTAAIQKALNPKPRRPGGCC